MFSVKPTNTIQSSIVAMGKRLSEAMKETQQEYLLLNRGVNSVVNLNLNPVVENIDFNSNDIQVYPGGNGKVNLRNAINTEYFDGKAETKNILVTGGGISGLDIAFQNINIGEVLLPKYFWGTYLQLFNLRQITSNNYYSYEWLRKNAASLSGKAIIICDPGNPLGDKYNDTDLIELIRTLDKHGAIVIIDSPYRRLFFNKEDTFYQSLLTLENVIIIESFSKSFGLSGQRIGFIHSTNSEFTKQASLRLLYATNGINSFAQTLITELICSEQGQKEVVLFKTKTVTEIKKNIDFLIQNKLLASEYYPNTEPLGIFAVINKSQEELFNNRIGSVSLDYFSNQRSAKEKNISRILVSIPNEKFVSFLHPLI